MEAVLPEGISKEDALHVFLGGVYGGALCGLGILTVSAYILPDAAIALVSASFVAFGFITISSIHAKAAEGRRGVNAS